MYQGNDKITICDHPLIKHKTTMIRKEETGTNEFRKIVEEISVLLGYEALRDLEMEEVEIKTPIEVAKCPVIAGKKQAIIPILRAGLGMVEGFLTLMPAAKVGHIGMYRDEETHEPHEYFCKLPNPISERKIYVKDWNLYKPNNTYDDYGYGNFKILHIVDTFNNDTLNLCETLSYGEKIGFKTEEECQKYCDWLNNQRST